MPIFERNLLNTLWVIGLPSVTTAFNIFLLERFFDSIPGELLDAAAMDGASPLRTLWSIVLPISRPVLGVVSIFAVVGVWKDFLWPMLTLPDPATQTLNVGIYSLSNGVPVNVLIAALTIASLPTLLIFPRPPAPHHERSDRGRPRGLTPLPHPCPTHPSSPPARSRPRSGAGGEDPPPERMPRGSP